MTSVLPDLGHRQLKLKSGERNENQPIRIMQVTDVHHFPKETVEFDRGGSGSPSTERFVSLVDSRYSTTEDVAQLKTMLEKVQPHLVVLTGDIIDARVFGGRGRVTPSKDGAEDTKLQQEKDGWRRTILEYLEPIVAAGRQWTFVPGNHDDDGGPWSRQDLLGIYNLGSDAPGCISEGAKSFNHTLTVGMTSEFVAKQSLRLWLFDSGGNHPDPSIKYHTFDKSVVAEYKALSSKLPPAACELAYFHIPLPQASGLEPVKGTNGLFDAALHAGKVPLFLRTERNLLTKLGIYDKFAPLASFVRAIGRDRVVGSSKSESGLFNAMVEEGKIKACFFGHDHQSDAIFIRQNLYMMYGRAGATTPPIDWEGDAGPAPFSTGARVLVFAAKDPSSATGEPGISTWIETPSGKEPDSFFILDGKEPPSQLFDNLLFLFQLFIVPILVAYATRGQPLW